MMGAVSMIGNLGRSVAMTFGLWLPDSCVREYTTKP